MNLILLKFNLKILKLITEETNLNFKKLIYKFKFYKKNNLVLKLLQLKMKRTK